MFQQIVKSSYIVFFYGKINDAIGTYYVYGKSFELSLLNKK